MERYEKKIDTRDYRVGIIGLGYVGLPLVMVAVSQGFETVGFDVDEAKVAMLGRGEAYLKTIPAERIRELAGSGKFRATTDFAGIGEVDVVIICVPTPLTAHREPDLSYITSTAETIAPNLKKGQLVILESTTWPGTSDEVLAPILETSGLKCGEDFYLAFSPEREDPGNTQFTARAIPKVVGGYNEESGKRAAALYRRMFEQVVPVSSTRVAEAVKLSENIFRSVNIALVNELKMIYTKMGIDIWEVIEAAKTKPFGFMPFYPGPGLGGHCIPIDPFYLTWKAHEYESPTRFIEIAGEINTSMPAYVIDRLTDAMNERGKPLKGARVLVVGVAYKRDVDDMRESPSLKLLDLLFRKRADASYHDPYIPSIPVIRKYRQFEGMKSVPLTGEAVRSYDVVLIATDHTSIDYQMLVDNAALVVDTRNATKDVQRGREKIVRA
ncbi:nucleotide sugar dehydrogenase [Candidatus Latescibacterota bacterium]